MYREKYVYTNKFKYFNHDFPFESYSKNIMIYNAISIMKCVLYTISVIECIIESIIYVCMYIYDLDIN